MKRSFLKLWRTLLPAVALVMVVPSDARAQNSADAAKVVVPFVEKHCVKCDGMINGLGDLKQSLLEEKEGFARHVAEKMLTYALGRELEYYDKRAVDRIVSEVAKDDFKFSRMVIAIAQSDPFRFRRGKDHVQ